MFCYEFSSHLLDLLGNMTVEFIFEDCLPAVPKKNEFSSHLLNLLCKITVKFIFENCLPAAKKKMNLVAIYSIYCVKWLYNLHFRIFNQLHVACHAFKRLGDREILKSQLATQFNIKYDCTADFSE